MKEVSRNSGTLVERVHPDFLPLMKTTDSDQTEEEEQGFAVEPKRDCPHVRDPAHLGPIRTDVSGTAI